MQVAESVIMETFEVFGVGQFFPYLDHNNISKTGCRWLSKSNWKQLRSLWLSNIKVTQHKIISIGRAADI